MRRRLGLIVHQWVQRILIVELSLDIERKGVQGKTVGIPDNVTPGIDRPSGQNLCESSPVSFVILVALVRIESDFQIGNMTVRSVAIRLRNPVYME